MSKRGAGFQLTRFEHEAERPEVPIVEVQKASNDVMAKRQIAPRPKARHATGGPNGSGAAPNPFANPFAGFAGNNAAASAPVAAPAAANTSAPSSDRNARIAGLNIRFAKTIEDYSKKNPGGSWAAACEKYLNYIKTIENAPAPAASATSTPTSTGSGSAGSAPTSGGSGHSFKPPTSFTFGKPAPDQGSSAAAVKFEPPKSFTFGGQPPKEKEPEPAKPKENPFILFGDAAKKEEPKQDAAAAAPKFSFGAASTEPKINFTGNSEAPKFTFGANSSNSNSNSNNSEAPKFSFGKKEESSEAAPKFTFGKKEEPSSGSDAAAPKFSFGSSSTPAPAKFSFGNTSEAAPKFTFGSSNTSEPAKFSFGQPSAGTANVNSTWKPSEKPQQEDQPQEIEDEQTAEPQQDFTGKGAGEENEDSVFETRAKLYDSKNEVAGLGVLRILVNPSTKKSRVVLRADGSGRILLNTVVPSVINYAATSKFVTIPSFVGSEKPTPYKARVKTDDLAKELADKLNEVKA